jgi:UDP-glucose 4-epimerase
MRIAVTGAAGFVGSTIVRRLVDEGHHVLAVDNLSTGSVANIEGVKCDWFHTDAGDIAYSGCDAVVHAAAYPDVSQNWKSPEERYRQFAVNALLTSQVLERVEPGTRFVLLSTCAVYAGGHVHEHSLPRATSPYAASKLAAEALVSAYAEAGRVRGCVLRLVNVVGARYHHGHLADFVRMARAGHVRALDDGKKAKSFVHVDDVADVVARSLEGNVTGPYNVTSRECWSWRDSIEVMQHMRPDLVWEVSCENRAGGWVGDPDELVVESLWVPPGKRRIADGVQESLESLGWMR